MSRDLYNRSANQSLPLGLPSKAERAFAEKIWRQLPPLDKCHIVILSPPMEADDVQRHANQLREPVALVNRSGTVLAFRKPQ
jgi:hypothetical protein